MKQADSGELAPHELEIDGRRIHVRVRRSRRARHAWVRVSRGQDVEVVLPRRMARRHVARILAEKDRWLRRQLERPDTLEQRRAELGLDRAGVVWLHGAAVPIAVVPADGSSAAGWSARMKAGTIVVRGPAGTAEPCTAIEQAVMRWYRREARRRVGAAIEREAGALGVAPAKVAIRDQRTRWGSCSSLGTLSFSWRLLVAPLDVFEYVVVHELCHLLELNHSGSFWRHVAGARPGYREQVAWLREYGRELHDYRLVLP